MSYSVISAEFGREELAETHEFDTLALAGQYIHERWQGPEYMDGVDGFHTDYCTYDLKGFTLNDIGRRYFEDGYRCFDFNPECISND